MAKECYEILGVDETATDEEIEKKYQSLREKYAEDRWLDGEDGNEAARKLTKLDAAYEEIKELRKERSHGDQSALYSEVGELLKNDDLEGAQRILDDCNERDAEWHYLQAVVFYKKNWANESKKQLEIAMQMDGDNIKYRNAYQKLNAKNDYEAQSPKSERMEDDYEGEQMGGNACSNCISCCYTYLCVNRIYSLCCGCR